MNCSGEDWKWWPMGATARQIHVSRGRTRLLTSASPQTRPCSSLSVYSNYACFTDFTWFYFLISFVQDSLTTALHLRQPLLFLHPPRRVAISFSFSGPFLTPQ